MMTKTSPGLFESADHAQPGFWEYFARFVVAILGVVVGAIIAILIALSARWIQIIC